MKKILTLFLIPLGLFASSIMSNEDDYLAICKKAAANPSAFATFRRNRAIIRGIEGVPKCIGQACLNKISEGLKKRLPALERYETIGAPRRAHYDVGRYSPCTLRYVMILGDLKKRFGSLADMRIAEIGGGFGGMCAVTSILESFASYTLIDLPCALDLAKTFLDTLEVKNVSYIRHDCLDQVKESDLIISNYAFSEIESKYQLEYLEKVIKSVPRGYMIINFHSQRFGICSLTLKELKTHFKKAGHNVVIEKEPVQTNARKPNILLTWGNDLQK